MRLFLLLAVIILTTSCAQTGQVLVSGKDMWLSDVSGKDMWLSDVSEKDMGLSKASFFQKYSGATLQRILVIEEAGIEVYTNVSIPVGNRIFILFEDVNEFNKCPFSSSGKCRYSYAKLNDKPIYTSDWAGTGNVSGFFSESDLNAGSSPVSKVLFDKLKVYDTKKLAVIRSIMLGYGLSYNAAYTKWIANGQSLDDSNLTGVKARSLSYTPGYSIDFEAPSKPPVLNAYKSQKNNQKNQHTAQKSHQSNPQESLASKLIGAAIDIYKLKEESKINKKNLREAQKAARIGAKSAIKKAKLMKQAQKPMY